MKRIIALVFGLAVWAQMAAAEIEISLFMGYQTSPHSTVTGNDPGGVGAFNATPGWDGKSFTPPPFYGLRATYWRSDTIGYGLGFTHAKTYMTAEDRAALGFSRFEFTDGHNIITANVFRRWPGRWGSGRITPYTGFGVGFAMPHVDVESAGGKTFGYQITGPAVAWTAGASMPVSDSWNVFAEYSGSYSQNDVDLDNGGSFKTNLITNALNIGVGYTY